MGERLKNEFFESFREKYHRATKRGKSALLDELCKDLDIHWKLALRLLRKRCPGRKSGGKKRGPKAKYADLPFKQALRLVWREMEHRCSKLIKVDLPHWLPAIEKHHGPFEESVRQRLLQISAATMDRYLKPFKIKGRGGTKPGTLLKNQIPIAGVWDVERPGFMESDTVLHCGSTTDGDYVVSLDMLDIKTHWVGLRATWGKGATGIVEQIKDIESGLPFPLLGFDCDGGTEFLNNHLLRYFTEKRLTNNFFSFTRSRPYMKNDNAHVEQKNWSTIRQYLWYDRFDFPELVPLINDLYKKLLCPYLNHFCSTFKVEQKVAIQSHYKRIYGMPATPYQRVLASSYVTPESKEKLLSEHQSLDPVLLRRDIERQLKKIFSTLKALRTAHRKRFAA